MSLPTRSLFLFLLLAAFGFLPGNPTHAREVTLETGQTFTEGDLTVRCQERSAARVITLTDCQFWDEFDEVCLYQRTRHHYGDLTCIEECQHWDNFNDTCHFATKCEFFPDNGAFVMTTCDAYDDVENVCLRTTQRLLQ